jgi:hypothetical protein
MTISIIILTLSAPGSWSQISDENLDFAGCPNNFLTMTGPRFQSEFRVGKHLLIPKNEIR